jgi:hypothetical protein
MKRTFFFHYNKIASRAMGKPVLTVHWRGKCIRVSNIQCWVPVETKFNKRQPHVVMKGKANDVVIWGDEEFKGAYIL